MPTGADLYVFNPSLLTLPYERTMIRRAVEQADAAGSGAKVFVTGLVAHALPEAFDGLGATVLAGEPEQLRWKLDDALAAPTGRLELGQVADLDALPFPEWSLFKPHRFRIGYDFSKFPTGLVQASRGCTLKCNYCPYIIQQNAVRFRSPESVLDEMRRGIQWYGFRSFKFRDPLFGLDRQRVLRLAEGIGSLPRKIQFSIESRLDLLKPETLAALKDVGLTSITVGIETPDLATLKHHTRAPISEDKQRQFVELCSRMGIRTVAGFMIGFPHDTRDSILAVLDYARKLNPTFANFNVVTPYPGTPFFKQIREQIASFDFSQYSVYTPVLRYEHLTAAEVSGLLRKCFTSYYFRARWFENHGRLLWPWLPFPNRTKPADEPADEAPAETTRRAA